MADFSKTNQPEDAKLKSRQLANENKKLASEVQELTKRNGQLEDSLNKLRKEFETFKDSIEYVEEDEVEAKEPKETKEKKEKK